MGRDECGEFAVEHTGGAALESSHTACAEDDHGREIWSLEIGRGGCDGRTRSIV